MITTTMGDISKAVGLSAEAAAITSALMDVLTDNLEKNQLRRLYFEGKARPKNIGISIPDNVHLDVSCSWPEKAVTSLANRSNFDGYVGGDSEQAMAVVKRTCLVAKYARALPSELIHGCTFATLTNRNGLAQVNFHSAETAAGIYDEDADMISAGIAIVDGFTDKVGQFVPTVVNVYLQDTTWVLTRGQGTWSAEPHPHSMGRPMIEPLIYRGDTLKPFGYSRITRPVMMLADSYMREMERVEMSAEFYTNPQRWAAGLSQDQLEALVQDKWKYVMGSIMGFTDNPETGDTPTVGQFSQMSMGPHIDYINSLANQFSGVTSIPVSDLGVVQSTYVSAEAVQTASANLCIEAEKLNLDNQVHLDAIMAMALAIDGSSDFEEMSQLDFTAHFRDPRKPSLVAQADAMLKAIQAVPKLAATDYALEQLGITQADIIRINADAERAEGIAGLVDFEEDYGTAEA